MSSETIAAMTIRILVADDQEMIRSAFRMILNAQPDMEVIAEAADGATAVAEAKRLRPDVCLLDIRMPEIDGLEATRLLAGHGVDDPLNVLIATTFDIDEYVHTALLNGAHGFLLKDCSPALLIEAVRATAEGHALISPSVTARLLPQMARRGSLGTDARDPRNRTLHDVPPTALTDREMDVVRLLALGRTNDELAAELFVTVSTVKTHLASIQRKIGARNRVEIAAWAWNLGIRKH